MIEEVGERRGIKVRGSEQREHRVEHRIHRICTAGGDCDADTRFQYSQIRRIVDRDGAWMLAHVRAGEHA